MTNSTQAHREGGGTGDTSPGPPNFFLEKGPHEAFLFIPFWAAASRCFFFFRFFFFRFPLHCLDSMSERLGRIISNAFMVSVDKYFDVCKHAEPIPLID